MPIDLTMYCFYSASTSPYDNMYPRKISLDNFIYIILCIGNVLLEIVLEVYMRRRTIRYNHGVLVDMLLYYLVNNRCCEVIQYKHFDVMYDLCNCLFFSFDSEFGSFLYSFCGIPLHILQEDFINRLALYNYKHLGFHLTTCTSFYSFASCFFWSANWEKCFIKFNLS